MRKVERFLHADDAAEILEVGRAGAAAIVREAKSRMLARLLALPANASGDAKLAILREETARAVALLDALHARHRAAIDAASSAIH
jgi:hypothetical protein